MKIHKPHQSPYALEQCAKDCHDWLTSHDVIALALAAFYAAQRDVDHPDNFPVCKRGQGRYWMAEELTHHFERLIHDFAYQREVPGFNSWASDSLDQQRADTAKADLQKIELQSCHGGAPVLSQKGHKYPLPPAKVQAYADSNGIPPTLSQKRQDIPRRASHNETNED